MARALLPFVLVISASIAGCGGHGTAAQPAPQPAPRQRNTVDSQTIADAGDVPIEKLLADRVSGVRLGRASDGSLTVTIRGMTSWNTDNQPLYVIDGIPVTPGPGGALSGLNPHDIEKIEVLKDPANTAMYGSRGANGVIVIKTKKR